MITCYLRYTIDMYKRKEFLEYAKMWIPLVEKHGGKHHGYFLPKESAWLNDHWIVEQAPTYDVC